MAQELNQLGFDVNEHTVSDLVRLCRPSVGIASHR